ncbi:MAG: hypothetical protein ACK4WF_09415, partial [Candidatus Brocadiales bacterium]
EIIGVYMGFLREVAKHYLKEGRQVFFRESRLVHYGEGGFGSLIIEGKEDIHQVFKEYILEIKFETDLEKEIKGYEKIRLDSLDKIRYHQDEWP